MGFLSRLIGGADRVDQAAERAGQAVREAVFERPYVHSVRMQREGDRAIGRIVGIERSSNDGTDRNELAVACLTDEGVVRYGMKVTSARATMFRFGQDVPLRLEGGKRAVIDVEAMGDAGAGSDGVLWVEPIRKPPADGIVDKAIDWGVQRRLKKGVAAGAGTIVGIRQRTVMGMAAANVDVAVVLADGRTVVDENQVVPFYAQWLLHEGAVVPVLLDPNKADRATIDWVTAAREAGRRG